MKKIGGPPEGRWEGRECSGVEDDATREGDAPADAAAHSRTRKAGLDQAVGRELREGFSRDGVVLHAEKPEGDGREGRPEVRSGGGGRRGGWATLHNLAVRERTRPRARASWWRGINTRTRPRGDRTTSESRAAIRTRPVDER